MTTYTTRPTVDTNWDSPRKPSFLLLENGGYILQETGSKILLNQYGLPDTQYTVRTPV